MLKLKPSQLSLLIWMRENLDVDEYIFGQELVKRYGNYQSRTMQALIDGGHVKCHKGCEYKVIYPKQKIGVWQLAIIKQCNEPSDYWYYDKIGKQVLIKKWSEASWGVEERVTGFQIAPHDYELI